MLESNKYADILGLRFDCHDDLPLGECPAFKGEFDKSDISGKYICRQCLSPVGMEVYDEREDLYDEEDDQDAGAMNEDSNFVAEGDNSMTDWTPDFAKRVEREEAIIKLIDSVVDGDLSRFMAINQREIVDELRVQEQSDNPLFRDSGSQRLAPKIIAVAHFLQNKAPNRALLLRSGISPTQVGKFYAYLSRTGKPYAEPKIEMTFLSIGKQLKIPESLVRSALEEYETSRPPSSRTSVYDQIVAWLYVMCRKYGFKLTQKEAIRLSGAGRNSTQIAIKEFNEFVRNLKVGKETPTAHGLKGHDDLE